MSVDYRTVKPDQMECNVTQIYARSVCVVSDKLNERAG